MRRIAQLKGALALALIVPVLFARAAQADDAVAEFRLGDRDTPHVGVPFFLDLVIEGFDEAPQPDPPKLAIASAAVTFVAVEPNVQRGMQIINGRRSDFSKVTWVMRWSVEPHKEGRLRIPSVTVSQGSKRAVARAGETDVDTIPVSDNMKLSLALPERPIFVGETVPVTLTWLFRAAPQDSPKWSIPLLALDTFTVSAPPAKDPRKSLKFQAGSKELAVPYEVDKVDAYNRLVTTFWLAPKKPGKLDVPASSVVAALQTGRADFFGNAPSRLFRAMDVARTLEVKPLPETDKPNNFAGAVGDQFSIDVTTSRSVVKLGEPVELAIRIKSNQRLDALALGRLDGEGGLPKDKFQVPSDQATGELSEDGKTKTFKVTAQVTGPATEVPAIAFSYFDPVKGAYQTIRSEPIALSVAGSSVVSAGDVVAAQPKPGAGKPARPGTVEPEGSLVDAELALSTVGAEEDRPIGGALLWTVVALLYAIPLALLATRSWQLRTQTQREEAAEVRAARRRVEDLLDRAGVQPARDIAGPLAAALRELAKLLGSDPAAPPCHPSEGSGHTAGALGDGGLVARLETESFSQSAAAVPLSPDLRSDAAGLLRRWLTEARKRPARARASAAMIVVALGAIVAASPADATPLALAASSAPASTAPLGEKTVLEEGRAAYQEAMQLTGNATARKAAFARAATAFGEAVRAMPDRPELLTDWGNAALGAGDVATATLAFRRALAVDGGNARARHNLAWLRGHRADAFRPAAGGATDTLLFFHVWPRARKLIVGSAAFAIAILLLVPWAGRRRRGLVGLALLPLAVWIAMIASVAFEDRHSDDAVVMDDVVLRAADSAGAPAALSQPLPRGVEVTVLERRAAWTRVRIAGGMTGWVPTGAVERVMK